MDNIKKINVPMVLICLISLRMMLPDASLAQAIFGLGLVAAYGYKMYMDSKVSKTLDQQVKDEMSEMKAKLSNLTVKSGLKNVPKDGQRFF